VTGHPTEPTDIPGPAASWVERAMWKQQLEREKARRDGHPAREPEVERVEVNKERE